MNAGSKRELINEPAPVDYEEENWKRKERDESERDFEEEKIKTESVKAQEIERKWLADTRGRIQKTLGIMLRQFRQQKLKQKAPVEDME